MPYDPNQPRVPAGVPEGGEWTSGGGSGGGGKTSATFKNDAGIWVHPKTGQVRVYSNNHEAGDSKVWIQESENDRWDAFMSYYGSPGTSIASIKAGSRNPRDIAGQAAESKLEEHGLDARTIKFSEIVKNARPPR